MSMERAKAEDWYSLKRVGDDITYIGEPFIEEFYRCNIWHVRGRDGDMLIDSGMGVVSLTEWVPLVTERSVQAVASHTHFDHIGCHHEFDNRICHRCEADPPRRVKTRLPIRMSPMTFSPNCRPPHMPQPLMRSRPPRQRGLLRTAM